MGPLVDIGRSHVAAPDGGREAPPSACCRPAAASASCERNWRATMRRAGVAEQADATDLNSVAREGVRGRTPAPAPLLVGWFCLNTSCPVRGPQLDQGEFLARRHHAGSRLL